MTDGAQALGRLARDLKAAGRKDLRAELVKGLRAATKPMRQAAKSGTDVLPQRGGLAARVRRASTRTAVRMGANPSVSIVARESKSGSVDLAALDRGVLRHPVFGNRSTWAQQAVPAGWFTDAMREAADGPVRKEITDAIDRIASKLEQG